MRRATTVAGVAYVCSLAVLACLLIIKPASPTCPPGYGTDEGIPGVCIADKHEPFFESTPRVNGLGLVDGDARLTSPAMVHAGGCAFVSWWNTRDLEDGFDVLTVEWSSDNTRWNTAAVFTGKNAGDPAYSQERAGFHAPAGPLFVRFRVISDLLLSAPLYLGVAIDDVVIGR